MNCFHFKGQSKSKQDMESHPKLERRDIPMTLRVSKQTVKSPTLNSLPSTPGSIAELSKEKAHTLRVFSYEELRQATKGFSRKLIIGEGGFGIVYKGTVRAVNGSSKPLVVAIKVLKGNSSQACEIPSSVLSLVPSLTLTVYNMYTCKEDRNDI